MELKHLDWLQIEIDNQKLYGYNQDWYTTSFQKTRGCGPTVASMLIFYMNMRKDTKLPYQSNSIVEISKILEEVWNFVTPSWLLGLNSTEKFCKGIEKFVLYHELNWQYHKLSITACQSKRVSLYQVVEFLDEGLNVDSPIAFLNLHRGSIKNLDSWHWIVLVALDYDTSQNRYIATCYDSGNLITFDLGLWLKTSRFGGGFVYLVGE